MEVTNAKDLAKQLPDPESCDAYDYLQTLNELLQDYIKKFGADQDALRALKSEVVLPLDRDQIIVPRLLSVINRYRDKAKIDLNVIRGIVDTYVLVKRMSYDFEKEYSNATAAYYKHEINMMLNDFGIHKILLFVNEVIESEKILSEKINLPAELSQDIRRILIEALLKDIPTPEEFVLLVREKKHDTLKKLFQLLKLTHNSIESLLALWRQCIRDQARKFLECEESTMEDYIKMKKDYNYIVNECFEGHEEFARCFVSIMMNTGASTFPLLCVKYADKYLKGNIEHRQSKEELDSWMNNVTELIPFFDEDVLYSLYQEYFVRRVLAYKTLAMDAERLMMSKIPHLSPNNMLKYVGEEMEEMSHKFQEYLVATKTKLSLALEIKLLYGSWTSLSQGVQLKYPNQFQQAIDTFGHFFAQLPKTEQDFGTKRLYWTYPRHSTCTVVGNFESGSKQIFVTLGQAIVLLLFNDYSTLRFDEIAEKSGISADNLKLLLLPIARSGMLVKDTTTNFISEGDVFSFGNDFSSLRSEFDFSKGAKPSVTAQVNESSKIRIQAAIVRIMKHRQIMTWRKLVAEVYAMLAPSTLIRTRDINSAIPSLIEREFICHSSTDRNKLEYVA